MRHIDHSDQPAPSTLTHQSIPADDDGEVVTVAVDDDISILAQVLLREQKLISISPVQAVVVAACAKVC